MFRPVGLRSRCSLLQEGETYVDTCLLRKREGRRRNVRDSSKRMAKQLDKCSELAAELLRQHNAVEDCKPTLVSGAVVVVFSALLRKGGQKVLMTQSLLEEYEKRLTTYKTYEVFAADRKNEKEIEEDVLWANKFLFWAYGHGLQPLPEPPAAQVVPAGMRASSILPLVKLADSGGDLSSP